MSSIEQNIILLFNISNELLNKLNILDEKVSQLNEKVLNIEKKIDIVLPILNNEMIIENLKELKREDLNYNKDKVLKALEYRDYRAVISIFRDIYKIEDSNGKNMYPIKIIGKRSFKYYENNKWNSDLYGYHSMNIICLNIQNLFMKYNEYDPKNNDIFLLNQKFIYKLSDDKYKKSIFKNIVEEIRINTVQIEA